MLLAVMMVFALCACSNGGDNGGTDAKDDGKVSLDFVTGGEQGTYYAFGTVIAQQVSDKTDTAITAVSGNGSKANVEDLASGGAQLAFCQSDVMSYAYSGTNLFADSGAVKDFSVVAALYMEQVQIVTMNPDIRGKKVSIGASGSGVNFNAIDVLKAYGMTVDDIDPQYLDFGDSAEGLKDGKIDAAFVVAGAPTVAISDLSTSGKVYLVGFDKEHTDKLIADCPYYSTYTIKKDVYGTPADVDTVAVAAVVLARNDVSEDAVYNFITAVFDNLGELTKAHAKGGELSLEFASSITDVPYHPGAVKYFAEHDITVK